MLNNSLNLLYFPISIKYFLNLISLSNSERYFKLFFISFNNLKIFLISLISKLSKNVSQSLSLIVIYSSDNLNFNFLILIQIIEILIEKTNFLLNINDVFHLYLKFQHHHILCRTVLNCL